MLPKLQSIDGVLCLVVANFKPMCIDFVDRVSKLKLANYKTHGLIKACKPAKGVRILDATAGWGRDALILAAFGASVTMLERNPYMHSLLEDALKRLPSDIGLKLSLCHVDAFQFIKNITDEFDVIYIDPMHPTRKKSALVKKDLQIMQSFISPDEDARELIAHALKRTKTVVKWPQKQAPLLPPSHQINGKTVRFDVYV